MPIFLAILRTFWALFRELAPLFIILLGVAAVLEEALPPNKIARPVVKARTASTGVSAFLGSLMPLGPAGKIPLAASLRRQGAGWTQLLAFVGAGSASSLLALAMTLALGPKLAALRLLFAIVFGMVVAYAAVSVLGAGFETNRDDSDTLCDADFCDLETEASNADWLSFERWHSVWRRLRTKLGVFVPWLVLGLVIATLIRVTVSRAFVAAWLGGWAGAPLGSLLGIPFYFAAGTDVAVISELLSKGMSDGNAIAMMTAAPVLNLPVLSLLTRWIGRANALVYLVVCWLTASLIGIALTLAKL